jgi:uncharacterized protein
MESQVRPEITHAPVTAIVIGLLAGMFTGLLGVGGGLLMVPALVTLLRIRPRRAHGTSLAVILPTAIAGVSQYAEQGNLSWGVALLLAAGGVFGALIGTRLTSALNAPQLRPAFGLLVAIVGILMVLAAREETPSTALSVAAGWPLIVLVGAGAGLLSALIGAGGGILLVPAAVFLLGLPQKMAQGISLAVIIPVSITGALIHARKGNVIPDLAGWLACGAVVGAYVVAHFVGEMKDEHLKLIFGIFLVVVGGWMAIRRRTESGDAG